MSKNRKEIGVLLFFCALAAAQCRQQNIVLIVGDDMGWNDVGFHGSDQIPTPNIDALGYNGVILHRFYTQATCTPSRTALLTGNYPIRSAMQGYPMKAGENRYLPLDMPTLPEHLRKLGYRTHLVGKWHLGYAYKKYSPLGRGFDSHFGYWNGYVGYFSHDIHQDNFLGHDMHDGFVPDRSSEGQYATHLFTEKACDIIRKHNKGGPLFLMVSHLAPHTGKNGTELEVPDIIETNEMFSYIADKKRRLYADMVYRLDKSVGQIVTELANQKMLSDTLVVYISDNGGQTIGMHENIASNWPLKGLKFTLLEGGVRGIAVLYSSTFSNWTSSTINNDLFHISDLMPTFYEAAGGKPQDLGQIDGESQWGALKMRTKSVRKEILLDFDEVNKMSAIIGYGGAYKLVNGTYSSGIYDLHYGDSGRSLANPSYSTQNVLDSDVNRAIQNLNVATGLTEAKILQLRSQVDLNGCNSNGLPDFLCTDLCLFNLETDPCETQNVAEKYPNIIEELSARLQQYARELVPQGNRDVDLRSNPQFFNNTWSNWLENVSL